MRAWRIGTGLEMAARHPGSWPRSGSDFSSSRRDPLARRGEEDDSGERPSALASRIAIVAPREWPMTVRPRWSMPGSPRSGEQRRDRVVRLQVETRPEVLAAGLADPALVEPEQGDCFARRRAAASARENSGTCPEACWSRGRAGQSRSSNSAARYVIHPRDAGRVSTPTSRDAPADLDLDAARLGTGDIAA